MKCHYRRFRVILLTLALGLASVSIFNDLYERWSVVSVGIPQIESESPIYIFPKKVLTESIIQERKLINQYRDLSIYDFGGSSSNCNWNPESEFRKCNLERINARNFIWKHWQEKKRGYLNLKWNGVDAMINYQVFIEPDENGEWRIVWIGDRFGTYPNRGTFAEDIRQVKQKKARRDDYKYDRGIIYLSFLNKNGEEVETW